MTDGVFDLNIPKGQREGMHVKVTEQIPSVTIDVSKDTQSDGWTYRLTLFADDGLELGEIDVAEQHAGNVRMGDVFDLVRRPIRYEGDGEGVSDEEHNRSPQRLADRET